MDIYHIILGTALLVLGTAYLVHIIFKNETIQELKFWETFRDKQIERLRNHLPKPTVLSTSHNLQDDMFVVVQATEASNGYQLKRLPGIHTSYDQALTHANMDAGRNLTESYVIFGVHGVLEPTHEETRWIE